MTATPSSRDTHGVDDGDGDFLAMSSSTDNVRPSPKPNTWRIRNLTIAGIILGVVDLMFCVACLATGKFVSRPRYRYIAYPDRDHSGVQWPGPVLRGPRKATHLEFASGAVAHPVFGNGSLPHQRPGINGFLMPPFRSASSPACSWRYPLRVCSGCDEVGLVPVPAVA